ncbi:SPW repeat protein [Neobacillus cucumis]|uniref:SPW repeat protein n=1 Tax=Neobacillus cucumis TaxID=1740721 RepID=UPI00403EF155
MINDLAPFFYLLKDMKQGIYFSKNSYYLMTLTLTSIMNEEVFMMWQLWLTGLIGIWLIISPWVYGFTINVGAMWNSVIFGIIVLILAIWSGSANKNNS